MDDPLKQEFDSLFGGGTATADDQLKSEFDSLFGGGAAVQSSDYSPPKGDYRNWQYSAPDTPDAMQFFAPKVQQEQQLQQSIARERTKGEDMVEYVATRLPFVGALVSVTGSLDVADAAKAFESGRATERQVETLAKWIASTEREKEKGIGRKAVDLLASLPGTAVEFATTGGMYTAGKKAATKALGGVAESIAGRLASRAAGVAAQTLANPQMIAQGYGRQSLPGVTVDELGNVVGIKSSDKLVAQKALLGTWDAYTGMLTERLGGPIAENFARHLGPVVTGVSKSGVGAAIRKMFNEVGYNGPLPETAEEITKSIVDSLTGVQPLDQALPATNDLAAMLMAFSVPSAGGAAVTAFADMKTVRHSDVLHKLESDPVVARALAGIEEASRSNVAEAIGVDESKLRIGKEEREQLVEQAKQSTARVGPDGKTYYDNINEAVMASDPNASPENPNLPAWVMDVANEDFETAKKLGIVEKIRDLAMRGKTAGEIVSELDIPGVDLLEKKQIVRSVRVKLGIPSAEAGEEADALAKLRESKPAAVPAGEPVQTEMSEEQSYEFAAKHGLGKLVDNLGVVREAHERRTSVRAIQQGGGGLSWRGIVKFDSEPSKELVAAIGEQINGTWRQEGNSVTFETNTNGAYESSVARIQRLVGAGYELRKQAAPQPAGAGQESEAETTNEEVQAQGQGNQEGLLTQPTPAEAATEPGGQTPLDTPTGEAPPTQAPPQAQPQQPSIQQAIGIYNEAVDRQRESRGQTPLMKKLQQSDQEAWDRAMQELETNKDAAVNLVESIIKDPRPIRKWETALLLHREATLDTEYNELLARNEKAVESKDPAAIASAATDLETKRAQLDRLEEATQKSGSELGYGLQARQMMLADRFTLVSMIRHAKAAAGSEYSQEMHDEMVSLKKKLDEANAKIAEYEKTSEQRQANTAVDAAIPEIVKDVAKSKRTKTKTEARAKVEAAVSEFKKLATGKLFANPLDPELIVAGVKVVKAYVELGVVSFRDFYRRVAKDFGEKEAKASQAVLQESWNQVHADDKRSLMERMEIVPDAADPSGLGQVVAKMAEEFVASGIKDRDKLVDAIHAELVEVFPDLTRRQTMDLISQYGQFKELNKDPIKAEVRRIRGELQQIAKLEDIQNRQPLKKTGIERREVGDEERRLIQQVNEYKRKYGVVVTDPARQLKSALDALKTRLKNQISDLEKQIETKTKIVKTKTPVTKDVEAIELQAKRDELKKQFDEIFGIPSRKRKLTEQQRVAMAIKSTQRSIAEYERKLREGEVKPGQKAKLVPTPELAAIRAKRDALREELKLFRDQLKPVRTKEQIQLAALKSRLKRRTAELYDKAARMDFAPKPKPKKVQLDDEAMTLEFAKHKAEEAVYKAYEKYRKMNRTKLGAALEGVRTGVDASRAMVTSLDLSAVGRQGGFAVAGNPRLLGYIPDSLRAARFEEAEFAIAKRIEAIQRKNGNLDVQAGLELTNEDRLKKMEEVYMSSFFQSRSDSKILETLKEPVRGSERAYRTFLNLIRVDLFYTMANSLSRSGELTMDEAKSIANYVNVATGRGNIGKLKQYAHGMASVFWAPRWVISRFQLLLGQPFLHNYGKGSWRVRRAIAKEYAKSLIGTGVFMSSWLAAMTAYAIATGDPDRPSIELDPRSSDFLKLKFKNTRLDPLYGLSQPTVLLTRLATGQTKNTRGEILDIRGDLKKPTTKSGDEIFIDFLQSKISPALGMAMNLMRGKRKFDDDNLSLADIAEDTLVPLSLRDIKQAIEDQGFAPGVANSLLSIFGASLQVYGQRTPQEAKNIREQAMKTILNIGGRKRKPGEDYNTFTERKQRDYENAIRVLNTVKVPA